MSSDGGMLRSAGKRVWAKDTLILLDQIDNHLALCKSGWFEGMDKIMVWLSYLYTKYVLISIYLYPMVSTFYLGGTVKLGDKERFDKEQIGVKEPFPWTNLPIYIIRLRNIWH